MRALYGLPGNAKINGSTDPMAITSPAIPSTNGTTTIDLSKEAHLPWSEIAISFTDNTGQPVASVASGTISAAARGVGADQYEDFDEVLTLANGERRWTPFFSFIDSLQVTAAGLPADLFFRVRIINTQS